MMGGDSSCVTDTIAPFRVVPLLYTNINEERSTDVDFLSILLAFLSSLGGSLPFGL